MRKGMAIFGLAVVVVVAGILGYSIRKPVRTATRLADVLRNSDWSNSTSASLRQIARDYDGVLDCADTSCSAVIRVRNTMLRRLHLAPDVEAIFTLSATGDRVESYSISINSRGKSESSAAEHVRFYEPFERPDITCNPQGKSPWVSVALTPSSGRDVKALSRSLNFECLASLGGCPGESTARELWSKAVSGGCSHP